MAAKDVFKNTFKEAFKKRVKDFQEQQFLGMTIGYKVDPEIKDDTNDKIEKGIILKKQMSLEMILEAPIERERNFVILNSL